ncbi:MAG TPA: DUF1611 domain-containing protein [Candidatus Sulfotelmatobacter sp.]|nr:DUF1611 domain-containing protein [Candidatus Sulfotelmatobacter sp.]
MTTVPTALRYAVLADGFLTTVSGKTAHGVLRYRPECVAAVIDATHAGRTVRDVLPHVGSDAPIVATLAQAVSHGANALLVGVATDGGRLPPALRGTVLEAVSAGLNVASGLHELLGEDPEVAARARSSGATIHDVRVPPRDQATFTGAAYDVPAFVVLAVGSDCAVGKMTAMFEIEAAARADGARAVLAATGQTGILIAGDGVALDAVVADFAGGAVERLVLEVGASADVVLLEGQGAISHPAYAPVTFALLYGGAPDALVLCHRPGTTRVAGFAVPIPPLAELVRDHEALLARVKPARVCAVALDTSALTPAAAAAAIDSARAETGLPADDPVRNGGAALWHAIAAALPSTAKAALRRAAVTAP